MRKKILDKSRALAHIEKIHNIKSIEGADNIELVHVLGWQCIAKKGEFKENDWCVYIEIDSKVPSQLECFKFLENKGYKIKTMKLGKFNVISQGIALPINIFNDCVKGFNKLKLTEGLDTTKILGIVKIEEEKELDEIQMSEEFKIGQLKIRHKKLFKSKFFNWLMRFKWFREIVLHKYKKQISTSRKWPSEISKTDETRCENIPDIVNNYDKWIKTEKIDGCSSTYFLKRTYKKNNPFEFIVCSRNQVQPIGGGIPCYYEMAYKYDIEKFLTNYLKTNIDVSWVALQGEILGPKIQGNKYKLDENNLYIFNFIDSKNGRYNSNNMVTILKGSKLNTVPILEVSEIPHTMETLKKEAEGKSLINKNVDREGIVYRSLDGKQSFKNVSNSYLLSKNKSKKEK